MIDQEKEKKPFKTGSKCALTRGQFFIKQILPLSQWGRVYKLITKIKKKKDGDTFKSDKIGHNFWMQIECWWKNPTRLSKSLLWKR